MCAPQEKLQNLSGPSVILENRILGGLETILFVEDEAFVRDVACEVLRSAGYQVLAAKTAAEAMRIFELNRGDVGLLLTDVVLPGENGRRLAARLRQQHPGLKILFVTGYGEQMARLTGNDDECLAKPFSTEGLLRKVRQSLDVGTAPGNGSPATEVGSGPPAITRSVQDLTRYIREFRYPSEHAHFRADAWHAINRTIGFILPNRETALAENSLHSFGAIRAHSRQDDSDGEVPKDLGY